MDPNIRRIATYLFDDIMENCGPQAAPLYKTFIPGAKFVFSNLLSIICLFFKHVGFAEDPVRLLPRELWVENVR